MLNLSSEFNIPHGYRFDPTKEDIFCFYLPAAIHGEPVPCDALIELDIYGGENKEPWKIFDKDAKKTFWVFTKLKKKSKSRIDRTAGDGCWLSRSIKEVKDAHGQLLGFDKYFTFICKNCKLSQGNGHWIMHEFSLKDESSDESSNNYVICEIKNKDVVGLYQVEQVESNNKKRKKLDLYDEDMPVSVIKKVSDKNYNQLKRNFDERNKSKVQMGTFLTLGPPDSSNDSFYHEFEDCTRESDASTENNPDMDMGELVEFEDGTIGIALNLESNNVGVILMGDGLMIQEGSSVQQQEEWENS
ncbi:hypothetical protein REPUB_Repub20aG0030000 [Reevesia pubescens]